MSRATTPDAITVAPINNIYTVLAGLATLAVAMGLVVLFIRANTLGVKLF